MDHHFGSFVWDLRKEAANIRKHGVDFETAARAFKDPNMVERKILTVRFTYREELIRIYGAGYWRKGRRYYEAT